MKRLLRALCAIGIALQHLAADAAPSVTRYVDPFIGTEGTGHVFPGATRPFGMVAPSPDNHNKGWDYTSGYQYRAPRIMGFSNTHMSGTGIGDLGDVLLQPAAGVHWTTATTDFSARVDKASEAAHPGYYTVRLPAHGVKVELTAAQRVALHRYTFANSGRVQVLADLQYGILFNDKPRVTASDVKADAGAGEISGTVHASQWVEREASFVVSFSQPIERVDTLAPQPGDKAPRLLLTFDLGRGRELQARVALSTVDVAGARRNLADVEGRSFDAVRSEADAEWAALLGRIQIEAPARQKRVFYSALYRTLMHPSDIADADGRVRGPTGDVISARGGRYYSTLSLWDTFRGVHPLLTLLVPERVDGFVLTLLEHQRAMGYLPLWTAWGRETWTMIGNPALPVIADALAKGFAGFPRDEALAAMVRTSTAPRPNAPPWAQRDWADYEAFGYLPLDRVSSEAVSRTLEYGIGDDAVARAARLLGQNDVAERFAARAEGWRKLWDSGTQMMRGKDSQGRWRTPFDPLAVTSPLNNPGDYTEANAWQYTLTPALHDPEGLAAAMGGKHAFGLWLDRFFATKAPGDSRFLGQEALIGQYAHGNEPSHHVAYLYAYTDAPWKGHAMIRRVAREFYPDRTTGISGNDDCGQISAWYVLATLGLYPVVPASGNFVLGTPLVRAASVQLRDGRTLRIRADGFAPNRPYAKSALLAGQAVDPLALRYADLMAGGELRFAMAPLPR